MARPDATQLRIPKKLNERLKPFAEVLGCSVADLATRGLEAVCDQMEGSNRAPLIVEEYKLKLSYRAESKGVGQASKRK